MSKRNSQNPLEQEKIAKEEAEAQAYRSDEASKEEVEKAPDEEAEVALDYEEGAQASQVESAEEAAVHMNNVTAEEINKAEGGKKVEPSKGAKQTKKRSRKYLESKKVIEQGKLYSLGEAVELTKKLSRVKFDASVEIHLKLIAKKGKRQDESPKGIFNLPHGVGKEKKIVILDEKMIEEIARTKKVDFDIALATPEMMTQVVKIAKILGLKGKMPDPKVGTVTSDPQKTIEEIHRGKTEYRVDAHNNIHQMIGKVSWESGKLVENARAVIAAFPKTRLESVHLTSTISPSVALDVSKIL